MRDVVGTYVRGLFHEALPGNDREDVRELLIAVYSNHIGRPPDVIAKALVSVVSDVDLDPEFWRAVRVLIRTLTDGRRLGHT